MAEITAEHHAKNTNGKTYSYYHYTKDKKYTSSVNISLPDLEKQVEECFKAINFSDEFYNKLIAELKNTFDKYQKGIGQDMLVLQERQGAVKQQLSRIENLLSQGTITPEVYKKKAAEFEIELNKIELNIAKLKNKKTVNLEEFSKVVVMAKTYIRTIRTANLRLKDGI